MRAPVLFLIVCVAHAVAISGFVGLSGCAARTPTRTTASIPAPVYPPKPVATSAKRTAAVPQVSKTVTLPPVQKVKPRTARITPKAPVTGTPYTVKKGDTLSGIAVRHGVSWKTVADHNGIKAPYQIRLDQRLSIPGATKTPRIAW